MFRHQRKKVLFDDEEIRDTNAHESTEVVSFVEEQQTPAGRNSIDNVHAPTDLTYLIDNDLDAQVSVQIRGGIYDNVAAAWIFICDIGEPLVLAADSDGYIGVYPDNPYMQDFTVEVTAAAAPTEDGITITAIYAIDQ